MATTRTSPIPTGKPLGSGYYKLKDDDEAGNTYRGVYFAKYQAAIYVMHAFQKKSKSGRADPPEEVVTAQARVKWVELEHQLWKLEQAEVTKKTQGGSQARQPRKKGNR